jgi:hypothetical protein
MRSACSSQSGQKTRQYLHSNTVTKVAPSIKEFRQNHHWQNHQNPEKTPTSQAPQTSSSNIILKHHPQTSSSKIICPK